LQIAAMAAVGITAGLVLGAAIPMLVGDALAVLLPIEGGMGIHAAPLALAAEFGILVALCFSLWPLARAGATPAGSLFRDLIAPSRRWPGARVMLGIGATGAALAGLAVATADQPHIAAWYVAGAVTALAAFLAAGRAATRLARLAPSPGSPRLRLALANLHRPGAPTTGVVVSLGLGITALVAVVLIEGNLRYQIAENMPARAPDFFFIDIQPDQVAPFEAAVRGAAAAAEIRRTPMLRGRITAIAGVPVAKAPIARGARWMVRADRGLTWARAMPTGTRLIAGEWWPTDYGGPPLVSLTADAAAGFGVGIGDTLTVNVLGRAVTARISSIRSVRWRSLRLNFVMVFSPGILEAAPQTHLATVRAMPDGGAGAREAATAIERAVTDRFANVTAIRVREVLAAVGGFLDSIGAAVRLAAGVTVLAGVLVLAGALAAGHRRRVYDAVVLKVLGATRRDIAATYLAEYGLLGLATAVIAGAFGSVAAWAVVTRLMGLEWVFLPAEAALAAAASFMLTIVLGFIGTWRALGHKAAPLLRND
jgi:putative ABC transport system permease protein